MSMYARGEWCDIFDGRMTVVTTIYGVRQAPTHVQIDSIKNSTYARTRTTKPQSRLWVSEWLDWMRPKFIIKNPCGNNFGDGVRVRSTHTTHSTARPICNNFCKNRRVIGKQTIKRQRKKRRKRRNKNKKLRRSLNWEYKRFWMKSRCDHSTFGQEIQFRNAYALRVHVSFHWRLQMHMQACVCVWLRPYINKPKICEVRSIECCMQLLLLLLRLLRFAFLSR